jgi:hypothetical protein
VNVGENAFDPLRGELGASFSVYEKYTARQETDLKYGKTYTIDSIINLVPHPVWRTRPPSPAEQFSREYYGTNELRSGLGFSPLVECILNFSHMGIVLVFALTAVAFVRLDKWARARGRAGILIASVLLPSIVNWNRIDFAAFSKMFLIYATFLWALDWLLYRVPANPLVQTMQMPNAIQSGARTPSPSNA